LNHPHAALGNLPILANQYFSHFVRSHPFLAWWIAPIITFPARLCP
jgi:hypothetical protein